MKFRIRICFILLVFFGGMFPFIGLYADEIVIIANNSVPETNVSVDVIRNIFLGNITKWKNNHTIVVAILDEGEIHQSFLEKYIKRSPAQFKNVWNRHVFTGKGKKPLKFKSVEALIKYVSKKEDAVGYIPVSKSSDEVKIISD